MNRWQAFETMALVEKEGARRSKRQGKPRFPGGLRGQAFETMMLVVSVIVAVAILGFLLGILGNLGGIGVSDPVAVMGGGLKNVVQKGFGVDSPREVTFGKGVVVYTREIIGDTPLRPTELKFFCHTDFCSGSAGDIVVSAQGQSIEVKASRNIRAYVTVCGDDTRRENPKYCIAIARQATDSREVCTRECRLTSSA